MAVGVGGFSAPDPDLYVPIAQTWDGTAWTDLAWPLVGEDGADPSKVQCLSSTSCFVRYGFWGSADHRDRVAHWDGSTFSAFPSSTSHAQPLPKTFVAASVNFSLNPLKLPNPASSAFANSPVGPPPPSFFIICQNRL